MNKTLLGASLILGGLAAAVALLGQPSAHGPGSQPEMPATPDAMTVQIGAFAAATESPVEPASEFPAGRDTTGLLDESLGIDEVLDVVAADSGAQFGPEDRDRVAALLRADPDLRRSMAD